MNRFILKHGKLICIYCVIIITIAIVVNTGMTMAVDNNINQIYTRDELSVMVSDINSDVDSEKTKTTDLQSRTSLLESKVSPLVSMHAKDTAWVDLTANINSAVVKSIDEYVRYTIINKMVILDIGGVAFNTIGRGQKWLTLPSNIIPKTRNVTIVSSDAVSGDHMLATTMVYNTINSNIVCAHVSKIGTRYFGQMIWSIE